jgi:hypothetical protein
VLLMQRDDPDSAAPLAEPEAPAEAEEPPSDEDAAADEDAAEEPADPAEPPTDLDALIDRLAADPGAAGEKGDDLLDDLRDLRADPNDAAARDLIEEIADWMANGELDPDVGRSVVTVLEQESRPEAPELRDVSLLFAEVAVTLPDWGEKGEDLLSDLADLLDTDPPGQRIQKARELVDELEDWISAGEIDSARAQEALAVLDPLARTG